MKPFASEPDEKTYIPEPCHKCEYYHKTKPEVIGWEIKTPLGMWRMEGCVSELLCLAKKVQLILKGLYIETEVIQEWIYTAYSFLFGKEELDRKKFQKIIKTVLGFDTKNLSKKVEQVSFPPRMESMLDIFRMIDLTGYFLFPDVNYRCLRKPPGKLPQSYTIELIGQGGATDIMVCEDYGCICSASLGFESSEIKADLRILKGDTSPGDGLLSRIGRYILQAPGSAEIERVKKEIQSKLSIIRTGIWSWLENVDIKVKKEGDHSHMLEGLT